ncbi:uncharacterized protein LOC132046143 isoform X3 [Lycium ferocissimum]|uniref:uncharacterized protein LOC132046143 isoform X3 n=1 Tax=Lycium ferocissimum TaxID=112874 RepID=UPI002815059B|nr:uncharacterized protein LOC132046143 isoform X3 [Lycium ferocissimum]
MPRVNYKGGARDYYVIGYRRRERAEISWVPLLENSTAFDSQEVRLYQSLDRAVLIHFEDMCVNTLEEKNPKVFASTRNISGVETQGTSASASS